MRGRNMKFLLASSKLKKEVYKVNLELRVGSKD